MERTRVGMYCGLERVGRRGLGGGALFVTAEPALSFDSSPVVRLARELLHFEQRLQDDWANEWGKHRYSARCYWRSLACSCDNRTEPQGKLPNNRVDTCTYS